ncbi:hypothetical protein F4678DRAFT_461296 [Xylaria arbuscula]|nr:hypothetical protein F4678DRAFT_461296 [Xylaria arbuscula]
MTTRSEMAAADMRFSQCDPTKSRQSCDKCQASKVRCSRDKPICKRCAQRRFACVYSPSKRTGRPRKRKTDIGEMEVAEEEDDASPGSASTNHGVSPAATATPCEYNDSLFRRVVDTWISDRSQMSTQVAGSSHLPSDSDCYSEVLGQTTRLEQALLRTPSPPSIDLVLEAERDFNRLRHRLFACTGHQHPSPIESTASQAAVVPHAALSTEPCLATDRPVLLGIAVLAERVVGLLEDMFRLAAQTSQSMDQAADVVWSSSSGPSARRLQRSVRSVMSKPCVSLGMESYRELRLGDFPLQGQAKADAMARVLKLRIKRMLSALEVLDSAKQTRQRGDWRKRGQPSGGPLHWGGSVAVLDTIAGTLLDDLIRRMESLQGAMVLLNG